jgi:S1-C subfamily serine protease
LPGTPPPLPTRAADRTSAEDLRPTWLGIAFRATPAGLRQRFRLGEGAAQVTSVLPRSPAATAGLMVGDVILGPKGQPFTRPNQIRAFTMLSRPEAPLQLEYLREGKRRLAQVQLTPLPQ